MKNQKSALAYWPVRLGMSPPQNPAHVAGQRIAEAASAQGSGLAGGACGKARRAAAQARAMDSATFRAPLSGSVVHTAPCAATATRAAAAEAVIQSVIRRRSTVDRCASVTQLSTTSTTAHV
jgi:hypothetical protein